MKTEDLKSKITEILIRILGAEESEVIETADLRNDLGMDSLDCVELIMEFEKEFKISIPDDEAEEIVKVGDIFTYLKTKI